MSERSCTADVFHNFPTAVPLPSDLSWTTRPRDVDSTGTHLPKRLHPVTTIRPGAIITDSLSPLSPPSFSSLSLSVPAQVRGFAVRLFGGHLAEASWPTFRDRRKLRAELSRDSRQDGRLSRRRPARGHQGAATHPRTFPAAIVESFRFSATAQSCVADKRDRRTACSEPLHFGYSARFRSWRSPREFRRSPACRTMRASSIVNTVGVR